MVLAAFVLVLAAAATFAAGIATSRTSDGLVYVSILLSVAAFVILAIASVRARQASRQGALDGDWETAPPRPVDTEAATSPLLGSLDETQLDMSPNWKREARERWRDAETTIVDDELERLLEAEEAKADAEVPVVSPAPIGAFRELPEDGDEVEEVEFEEYEVEEYEVEPEAAFEEEEYEELEPEEEEVVDEPEEDFFDIPETPPVRFLPPPTPRRPVSTGGPTFDVIDDYDDLTAAEIVPSLADLDLDELRWVQSREQSGGNRRTVLNEVEDLIAERSGAPRPRAPRKPAAKKTATRKTAVKKPAVKKTAVKGTAKKATSRAKKAPAPVKKTVSRAKKAPAKRTSKSTRRG